MVVARLGLDQDRAGENLRLHVLPFVRADDRHALDVLGVLREELDLLPPRRPLGARHRGQVRQNPDRALAPIADGHLDLGLEGLDLVGRDPAGHLEPECLASALLQSLDHEFLSPFVDPGTISQSCSRWWRVCTAMSLRVCEPESLPK